MGRKEILDAAAAAITVDRAATHGDAENSFEAIAGHWTWWLGDRLTTPLTALDVAQMMVGFKQARARGNPGHGDNFVDLVGYGAIAGDIAGRLAASKADAICRVEEMMKPDPILTDLTFVSAPPLNGVERIEDTTEDATEASNDTP